MTVEPGAQDSPAPRDEPPDLVGERHDTLAGLVRTALGSWPATLRVAVLIGIITIALWLLPIDLVLGPLQITKH